MRRNVRVKHAALAINFKASDCWLAAFINRFGFSWRRSTNRKTKSVNDRLRAVRLYLARFARRLARHAHQPAARASAVAVDALAPPQPSMPYAMRIDAHHRLNVDQVPFTLDIDARYTYADQGSKAVHVAGGHGQHRDSRFGTLQVMVNLSAEARLQPKAVVVFRGQGNVSQQELDARTSRVSLCIFKRRCVIRNIPPRPHTQHAGVDGRRALCMQWLHDQLSDYVTQLRARSAATPTTKRCCCSSTA